MVYYLCAIHTTNFDLASELSTLDLHMMTPSDVITDLTTTVPLQWPSSNDNAAYAQLMRRLTVQLYQLLKIQVTMYLEAMQ